MERAEEFERQRYKVRTCMNSPDQDVEVKPPKFAGVHSGRSRDAPYLLLPRTSSPIQSHIALASVRTASVLTVLSRSGRGNANARRRCPQLLQSENL